MFFDTETIGTPGTPGCKCSDSTQANGGSQRVTEADRSLAGWEATSRVQSESVIYGLLTHSEWSSAPTATLP